MSEKMTTIEETAKILQTTHLNVLMHIKRGLLTGVEEESGWMIEQHSLDELLAKTGGVKATDVCTSGCAKKHACGGGCG
jgi:hypothetical protein